MQILICSPVFNLHISTFDLFCLDKMRDPPGEAVHETFVLIAYGNRKGSDVPVQISRLI